MAYIGNQPYQVAFVTDTFSGNGSTTAFTMSVAPANTSSVLVAVTGVLQDPSTYSVSGTTLTFTAAPPTGTGNISCRYLGIPASGVTTTAYRTVTEFTATAGQTTFTPSSYTVGFINVYRNGVLLGSADYTATNGTTVVLTSAAASGDLVTVESFLVSSVLNAIPATAGSVSSTYLAGGSALANIGTGGLTQSYLATGVAGTGPSFGAYLSSLQSITSSTYTLVTLQTEEWDTASFFNNTNATVGGIPAYAFLPTVAGYYQVNGNIYPNTTTTFATSSIYKNGAMYKSVQTTGANVGIGVSTVVYLNGSTDYIQLYGYLTGTSPQIYNSSPYTYFNAALVRAA